jgi:hypothetical protein
MRVLTPPPALPPPFVCSVKMSFRTIDSDKPLIRCAAHSALISLHGILQTFSVYDLKKIL